MTTRGSNVTLTLKYTDAFGNPADWLSTVSAVNEELASTATFTLARTAAGTYKTTQLITQPGNYLLTMENPPPEAEIIGTNNFGCSPGRPVRVRFTNVPTTLTAGEALTGAWMTFFDVRGRTTNNAADILTLSSRGAETIEPIPFAQRDPIKEQHSGIFDIEPIAFTALGTDTLRVDSDVDYRLPATGNDRFVVKAGVPMRANVTFGALNPDSTVTAGTAVPVTLQFRDTLGNVADVSTPVRLLATTSATAPNLINAALLRVLTRSVVNGQPQFTTTITPSTAGTYTFAVDVLPVLGRAPALVGKNPLVVVPTVANAAEFRGVRDTIAAATGGAWVAQEPFGVVFRDRFGNITEADKSVTFTKTGAPASTGTITLTRYFSGVSTATATAFTLPGTYTLSIPGIATANMTGQRTFVVQTNYTAPVVYTRAFVTVSGVPANVVAGNPVPSVSVTVRDSATGAPLTLTNPYGRWFYKGVSDIPLVLLATGAPGVYSAMSTKPLVTEAATYSMELSADDAVMRFQQETPKLPVIGSALHHVKVQEFLTAPAPLYTDILPGHRQGDTLPPFLIRGYDEFNNLTAIDNGVALRRLPTEDAPFMLLPITGRMIVRGLFESNPIPLDSVGEFSLVWLNGSSNGTPPPPASASAAKGGATVQADAPPIILLADDNGQAVGKVRVMERGRDTFEPETPTPTMPILICANPYIVPTRAASTQKIDSHTPIEARDQFADEGFQLVWSDEFEGTELDLTKWTPREGEYHPEVYKGDNNFLQYANVYSRTNVNVHNGSLRLTARRIDMPYPRNLLSNNFRGDVHYINGGVDGRYKSDFRYGKVVVKFKHVPNYPFMHHGAWVYNSENGAPGLEIDFPDGANSPDPRHGNSKTDAMGNPIKDFRYTHLNNAHPRMAVAIINQGGTASESTAFSEFSCAGRPDSTNELRLDLPTTEREYWAEWDRDANGGYIKAGVRANNINREVKWWGLHNHVQPDDPRNPKPISERVLGVQFIPDAERQQPIYIYNNENPTAVLNNSQTLERYTDARQSRAPFNRTSTWFYDYFPMNVQLDIQAFNAWAGGFCNPNSGHTKADGSQYQKNQLQFCNGLFTQMEQALAGAGQSLEIDYVRVYQRERSALEFRPLILNGEKFTRRTVARLYKTPSLDANADYVELETKPWNNQELVVMIKPSNERFVGPAKEGFIRVVNISPNGQEAVSNPKRIIFGQTSVGIIRTNGFSHRYANSQINTENLPGNPPRVIKEDNKLPFRPFAWNVHEQLSVDLFNTPALGGPAQTGGRFPQAFSSLPRIEQTRGKWDIRFLDANRQPIGTTRLFPENAATTVGTSWRLEGSSQYRTETGASLKAVRLSDADPTMVNLVTRMADAQYPQGYYPSCADLIEVTAQLATPPSSEPQVPPTDLYDPVNMCGPFTVRWYLDPKPQAEITNFPKPVQAADLTWTATMDVRINMSPMMGNITGATYSWQVQIIRNNAVFVNWTTATTSLSASSGTIGQTGLKPQDIINVRCVINYANIPLTTNSILDRTCTEMTSSVEQRLVPTLEVLQSATVLANTTGDNVATALSKNGATQTAQTSSSKPVIPLLAEQSTLNKKTHTVNLLAVPNPAESQVGLRFGLPDDAQVTVEVIDALQRVVLLPIENKEISQGEYEISIPVGSLPSGAYSVRVTAHVINGTTLIERRTLIIAR